MQFTENAKKTQELVQKGHHPNDIENDNIGEMGGFVNNISCSDGFWYGLTDGGYIELTKLLEGDDLQKAQEAVKLLQKVEEVWQEISIN